MVIIFGGIVLILVTVIVIIVEVRDSGRVLIFKTNIGSWSPSVAAWINWILRHHESFYGGILYFIFFQIKTHFYISLMSLTLASLNIIFLFFFLVRWGRIVSLLVINILTSNVEKIF